MSSSTVTPIRVRGKRGGIAGEKWHAGRRKGAPKHLDYQPTSATGPIPTENYVPPRSKRRKLYMSRLEALPTEILQEIFNRSCNVDLPCASTTLQSKLSSQAMYRQIATSIFRNVCAITPNCASGFEPGSLPIRNANRLLACRLMTRQVFRNVAGFLLTSAASNVQDQQPQAVEAMPTNEIWSSLLPSRDVLPPDKLLRGPWSDEKVDFLDAVWTHPLDPSSSRYALACEGLGEAVSGDAHAVATKFLKLGIRPDQELLRRAVMKPECPAYLVAQMLYIDMKKSREAGEQSAFDCLDPVIWSWAGIAESEGSDKASQCMEMLRYTADCVAMKLPLRAFMRRFNNLIKDSVIFDELPAEPVDTQ